MKPKYQSPELKTSNPLKPNPYPASAKHPTPKPQQLTLGNSSIQTGSIQKHSRTETNRNIRNICEPQKEKRVFRLWTSDGAGLGVVRSSATSVLLGELGPSDLTFWGSGYV